MNKYTVAEEVNFEVNDKINYISDIQNYKIIEKWVIPVDSLQGDCEDYALYKRKRLLELGWDIDKQHLVICSNQIGFHCVLLVETNKGNYLLDNCYKWPMKPNETDYNWHYMLKNGEWYEIVSL